MTRAPAMGGAPDRPTDVAAWLGRYGERELLRLLTCGSVDDGKSTLIGRLLYDSQTVHDDILAATKKASARYGTTGT
ncbi:MAG: hypothetical protein ACK539_01595, partial [Planctomycetota bacterium]